MRSLSVDISIPGIGRIHRRLGVTSARERTALVAMLRELPKLGYRELVRDIQTGRRKALEVYGHYTAGTLDGLLGPTDDQPLKALVAEWLETALVSPGSTTSRTWAFAALQPDGRRTYLMRDLPELVQAYRRTCEVAHHPRAFNLARTAVQAFLRDKLGRHHRLWVAVSDIEPLKERKAARSGFSLAEALAIRDQLGVQAGRCWWSMCLTGMGPKEYWTDGWTVEADRVHIHGQKTAGRVRDVPLVDTPVRPEITRWGFTSALRRLAKDGPKVNPYQARKTFARWMEDAQIPRARREIYRGHNQRDIGFLYEKYEVAAYLREDAQKMRGLLPQQGLRVVP